MYHLIRPLLFKLDTERAHALALRALRFMPSACFKRPEQRPIHALGLEFPHPIGLAAGFDKNGEHLDALAKLGFSFIELGTVTPKPQPGNPKPRLFRLPEANAIINRMGFNNQGVDALVKHVARADYKGILGINIGKNKDTPLTHAAHDYRYCLQKVFKQASYVTINISSPNTPDLRLLQRGDFFIDLLMQLTDERKRLEDQYQRTIPLLVKVSPDETDEALKQMAEVVVSQGINGIIATNTTAERETVASLPYGQEAGGLSGRPLALRSTACLRLLNEVAGKDVCLIGVGGIDSPEMAREKLAAGASLLQIYTGLIYQGPGLVKRLVDGLDA
ncbi:quinone-dependent dihydroorotate dehydrogenase [Legionella erythra]|uniref:Dihydroorotate dehydrogenase (quinone) n=1 Tax=Legionella erythra TaxID=448 RepID=A0A0W0TX53_LEGER|nr:quinone-dependent dihydroorotate dehydrogenase [Legionella erythra]KTC99944.1 Dihydroorotate dehydrogenase [Legionella erythra]